jgi:hypothetical protein
VPKIKIDKLGVYTMKGFLSKLGCAIIWIAMPAHILCKDVMPLRFPVNIQKMGTNIRS